MNDAQKASVTHSEKLWRLVRKFKWIFDICPFVRMVAVTNSLARNEAKETSDIDLLIVTKSGHLYTARLYMKILTQIFAMRVHHEKKAGRFCLSFFITEHALNLERFTGPTPLFAEFVSTLKPVYNQGGMYKKFVQSNSSWISTTLNKDLPDFSEYIYPRSIILSPIKWLMETTFTLLPLEKIAHSFQVKKDKKREEEMRKDPAKKLDVVIENDVFKFHEHNRI